MYYKLWGIISSNIGTNVLIIIMIAPNINIKQESFTKFCIIILLNFINIDR